MIPAPHLSIPGIPVLGTPAPLIRVFRWIGSPIGRLKLVGGDRGLAAILWENDSRVHRHLGDPREDPGQPLLRDTEAQLGEYFASDRRVFTVPLDLEGTAFQQQVWRALLAIPYGEVRRYGDIARAIGRPTAMRAVGAACGMNPISIIAPCHRVIGATGALTGFAGGLPAKTALLAIEAGRADRPASARPTSGRPALARAAPGHDTTGAFARPQADLFGARAPFPEGLAFAADAIGPDEEASLIEALAALDLVPFVFQRWTARRCTRSFGWRYDFQNAGFGPAEPIPDVLRPVRDKAAAFAGVDADSLVQASVIRYDPGAGIGWHRDRPGLDAVIGLSLGATATMRFRRRSAAGFDRAALTLPPRSFYHLDREVRDDWEHSIPPMDARRWSITFRGLAADTSRGAAAGNPNGAVADTSHSSTADISHGSAVGRSRRRD